MENIEKYVPAKISEPSEPLLDGSVVELKEYEIQSNLGNTLRLSGKLSEARKHLLSSLEINPRFAMAWNNMGCYHNDSGNSLEAMLCFEKAIYLDNTSEGVMLAYVNLNNVLQTQTSAFWPFVCSNVGLNADGERGQGSRVFNPEEITQLDGFGKPLVSLNTGQGPVVATARRDEVAELRSSFGGQTEECANKLNNLANKIREENTTEAIERAKHLYLKALEIDPKCAPAHCNVGSILFQEGKMNDAESYFKKACEINPVFAEAHNNLGSVMKANYDLKQAVKCYQKAIQATPTFWMAHFNLGNVFKDLKHFTEAIKHYNKTLEINPNCDEAYCNLIHCFQNVGNWTNYNARMEKLSKIVEHVTIRKRLPSVQPLHSFLYPLSHKAQREIAAVCAETCLKTISFLHKSPYSTTRGLKKRLKIGYVSTDFCNHPTAHLMQSIPGMHDKTRFEIFCYALTPSDNSSFRKKVETETEHFVDLSNTTNEIAADTINENDIDILVNVNGYTTGARNEIFALRPAPIQAMWLAFPGTSGATFMDYIITDKVTSPSIFEPNYSEKLAYMPNTFFIGDHKQMFHIDEPAQHWSKGRLSVEETPHVFETGVKSRSTFVSGVYRVNSDGLSSCVEEDETSQKLYLTREKYGIPESEIVFCNFCQIFKMDPETFTSWVEIVKSVPGSVLWLLRFPPTGEKNLREFAESLGLDRARLIFSDIVDKQEHVFRAQLADICLDTARYNGHTTSMDVLWSGTPIVTLPGETFASRVTASQLTALGCPELIARDRKDYVTIATRLGKDLTYLCNMRDKIWKARTTSPLFDCKQYTNDLENLYIQLNSLRSFSG
jgi:protein O-GlcNAc transferase